MTSSKLASALKPMASARSVRKRTGHVCTMPWMRASGTNLTRFVVSGPATRPIASSISRTVSVIPGRFTTRLDGQADAGESCACMKASTARFGERIHTPVVSGTGHSASTPLRGSRMMPLANEDAARFGLPGRTTIVGRRSDRPSRNPLRV
jgi:hypothetical protein